MLTEYKLAIKNSQPYKLGIAKLLLSPEIGILIPLIILCIFTGLLNPRFLTWLNFSVILRYATFMATITIGQAFVIMTGEIDLSVGANAGFSGIIFGLGAITWGLHPVIAIALAIMAGAAIGFVNGYLVASYGVVNFISTLATMFICIGLQITLSGGKSISPLPEEYVNFSTQKPLSLSWVFFIMLGILIISEIIIRFTRTGRMIQGVGGNKEAALMAGINVKKVKWGVYILSGALAGVAGILASIDASAASSEFGPGLEFKTITACAVGGISLLGGSGSILGVGVGILLINVLSNSLQYLKVESNWQLVIIGLILILAVFFDILKKKIDSKN